MTASTTKAISAAAYGEDVDSLDSWEDLDIVVEADGGDGILLDASPEGLDPDDYPMGRPGVGIRLTQDQALDLAISLLWQAVPLLAAEIGEAVTRSHDNLAEAIREGDYDDDPDGVKMRADRLAGWSAFELRFSEARPTTQVVVDGTVVAETRRIDA